MPLRFASRPSSKVLTAAGCAALSFIVAIAGCGDSSDGAAGGEESTGLPTRGSVDVALPIAVDDDAAAGRDNGAGPLNGGAGMDARAGANAGAVPDQDAAADAPSGESPTVAAHPNLDLSSNRLETTVVAPSRADQEIASSTVAQQEFAIWDTRVKAQRESLVVLIPSEGADPAAQIDLGTIVAGYGFHVVLPGFVNRGFSIPPCATGPRCSAAALYQERLEGIDSSDGITVAPPDGLERRIARMLSFMAGVNPAGDWGFYLSGDKPRWERVIVGGFSEGGTMAVFTSLHRVVSRVVMLGAPWAPGQGWVTSENAQTPSDALYGFVHQMADRYQEITLEWMALSLVPLGPLALVDGATAPYGPSHRLQSNAIVRSALCAHFSVAPGDCSPKRADGSYLYEPVWRYLFTGE